MVTQDKFLAGCRVLIDNGIEISESPVVIEALMAVMFDEGAPDIDTDIVPCCQNCEHFSNVCDGIAYHKCSIQDLAHWKYCGYESKLNKPTYSKG